MDLASSALNETAFLRFSLEFALDYPERLPSRCRLNQRFHLALDGGEFAYGPDRSDVAHWSLHTYEGTPPAGRHVLSAIVWWIADTACGIAQAGAADTAAKPPGAIRLRLSRSRNKRPAECRR